MKRRNIKNLISVLAFGIIVSCGVSWVWASRSSSFSASTDSINPDTEIGQGEPEGGDKSELSELPKFRFHCEQDTLQITAMLAQLAPLADRPINEIAVAAAGLLEGRPYVGHTLEGEVEQMVINVDQLDCVTFVENCFALARTVREGRRSWREFARNIESLRYRKGEQKGYDSRLHYTTDWINDNVYRGNIVDVTPSLAGAKSLTKSLDFMTKNRNLYTALQDEEVFQRCKEIEAGFRSMKIPYLTKESSAQSNVITDLKDGDMISFLSPKPNLDSSHVALLRIINGKPYMMHASLKAGKVVFEKEPLRNYFKYYKKDAPGFRVLRLKEN